MFGFLITRLRESGHGSVQRLSGWTLPLAGSVSGTVTDSDGDTWFYATLTTPIDYKAPAGVGALAGAARGSVTEVVLRPHYLDEQPSPGMRDFPMDFAVVLDPSMRQTGVIDLNRVDFIAVVDVDDAGPVAEEAPVTPPAAPANPLDAAAPGPNRPEPAIPVTPPAAPANPLDAAAPGPNRPEPASGTSPAPPEAPPTPLSGATPAASTVKSPATERLGSSTEKTPAPSRPAPPPPGGMGPKAPAGVGNPPAEAGRPISGKPTPAAHLPDDPQGRVIPEIPGLVPPAPPGGLHQSAAPPTPRRPEPTAPASPSLAEKSAVAAFVPPAKVPGSPPAFPPAAAQSVFPARTAVADTAFPVRESVRDSLINPYDRKGRSWKGFAAVGAVGAVLAAGWLLIRGYYDDPEPAAAQDVPVISSEVSTPTSPPPPLPVRPNPEDIDKVTKALPPGYPPESCSPADYVDDGGKATVACQRNSDAGGPVTARFTMFADRAALESSFDVSVAGSIQRNCPGDIQSPGPWRRNATKDKVAGTLFCGISGDQNPVVMWTDTEKLMLYVAKGSPDGPDLVALYDWWTQHS